MHSSSVTTGVERFRNVGDTVVPGEALARLFPGAAMIVSSGAAVDRGVTGAQRNGAVVVRATVAGPLREQVVQSSSLHSSAANGAAKHLSAVPRVEVVSRTARRYFPKKGDAVIGVITRAQGSTGYTVNVNGTHAALLDACAFDGATKANRPKLVPGDVVHCRVIVADRDVDIEVSCESPDGQGKDWVTGQSHYGQLKGGCVLSLPMFFLQSLRAPPSADRNILARLGERLDFEVAIGCNGRMWVKTLPTGLAQDATPDMKAALQTKQLIAVHRILREVAAGEDLGVLDRLMDLYFPPATALAVA